MHNLPLICIMKTFEIWKLPLHKTVFRPYIHGRIFLIFITFHLLLILGCNTKSNHIVDDNNQQEMMVEKEKTTDENQMLSCSGVLQLIPNPCLSEPCLPGQVYALQSNGISYILTVDGNWYPGTSAFLWKDQQIQSGSKLMVNGILTKSIDLKKREYWLLEIESLVLK